MSEPVLNEKFALSLRRALVAQPSATGRTKRRMLVGAGSAAGILALGGGVAVAAGVLVEPGSSVVTPVTEPVSGVYVGSASVELGPRPDAQVNSVAGVFTCQSAGTFTFDGGVSLTCSDTDAADGVTAPVDAVLEPGDETFEVEASDGARWSLSIGYAFTSSSSWAVNERGQTYGVQNADGFPQLVAVYATNGAEGYVYSQDLFGPEVSTKEQAAQVDSSVGFELPVYATDGVTRLGTYVVSGG